MDIVEQLRNVVDTGADPALIYAAANEIARLRILAERYETARCMNPCMWKDAWALNISTGKPFDEIIDELKPFMRGKNELVS